MNAYWLEQTEADVPAENDWLNANEAVCLAAMRFAKRRGDWRLGRWTAKCTLAAYLSVPAAVDNFKEMEICAAADGAPEAFVRGQPAAVTISLSHRSGMAICAVAAADAYLGCDLEMVESRSHAFVADYFTAREQARVARAPAKDRNRLVTLIWSAKESALKALRAGLRLDTRSVSVGPVVPSFDGHGWSPLSVRYAGICLPENGHHQNGHNRNSHNQGRYFGDHVFHGWWQGTDKIVRTVVAAPAPDSPIALKMLDDAFEIPYKFGSMFG